MDEGLQSLRKQLAEAEYNLRLIQERKSEYVLETDVPLQLIKEERRLLKLIEKLQQSINELEKPTAPAEGSKHNWRSVLMAKLSKNKTTVVWAALITACATIIAAMIGILPELWKIRTTSTPTITLPVMPSTESLPASATPGLRVRLSIRDLWPVGTGCQIGGTWWADLWIQPTGGDGHYKYYINGDWRAESIQEGVTIRLTSQSCTAIVGTASVESGGVIVSQEFEVQVPACCGK